MTNFINFNDIKAGRQPQNFSTFKSGTVNGVEYDKPVAYIKAYLSSKVDDGALSDKAISEAKAHLLNAGIVKATVNTQVNLFKNKLIKNNGVVENKPTLQYALKSINDLINFDLVAIVKNDKLNIIDKVLYESESTLKIAVSLNDMQLIIAQKGS